MDIKLRPYQEECIQAIESAGDGHWLVCMPTGCGKTATFTSLPFSRGNTLVLAHREELVSQPIKYYKTPVGAERAHLKAIGDEPVVIASVQSLVRRLKNYSPDHFGRIIIDEAHHACAVTYRNIIDYFSGAKQVIGVTATPARGDKIGLEQVFQKIIFSRDLLWALS